jgi:hypothetical protein
MNARQTQRQPARADHHDADLARLDDADDLRLVVGVGELAGQSRQREEGQDEDRGGQRAEPGLGIRLVVQQLVDDEQHHRVLVEIVVERVQELRDEQGQEAPLVQQVEAKAPAAHGRLRASGRTGRFAAKD